MLSVLPPMILLLVAVLIMCLYLIYQLSLKIDSISHQLRDLKHVSDDQNRISTESYIPLLVHELRAPVSVIKGASDLMLREGGTLSSEQIHTLLNQIRNSSSSLLDMIADILDVSKMEVGKFEVTKVSSNLANVLKEVSSYFEPLAKVKNVTMHLHIQKNPMMLSFDPERIKQVLNNLISNSLKFTEAQGHVFVDADFDDLLKVARISVSDTGVGILPEEKTKLFHKFVQGNNQNHAKEKGTGLGLVVSKGIVEAHGGKIWIEDNKPKGTRMIFTLPYES